MTVKTPTLYTYANCDTCRKAVKWLQKEQIEVVEKPIRDTPPSPAELRAMLDHVGGDLRKLFNTSGRDYREMKLSARLPELSTAEAIKLLAANGNLIKRPFLMGEGFGLVGFNADTWERALG